MKVFAYETSFKKVYPEISESAAQKCFLQLQPISILPVCNSLAQMTTWKKPGKWCVENNVEWRGRTSWTFTYSKIVTFSAHMYEQAASPKKLFSWRSNSNCRSRSKLQVSRKKGACQTNRLPKDSTVGSSAGGRDSGRVKNCSIRAFCILSEASK